MFFNRFCIFYVNVIVVFIIILFYVHYYIFFGMDDSQETFQILFFISGRLSNCIVIFLFCGVERVDFDECFGVDLRVDRDVAARFSGQTHDVGQLGADSVGDRRGAGSRTHHGAGRTGHCEPRVDARR